EFGRKYEIPFAEALGYEFLGENACDTGEWEKGLEYGVIEREIASRIHSRERLAWSGWYTGYCAWQLGDLERAEREFSDALPLAGAAGDRRLECMTSTYVGSLLADMGKLDEALAGARENLERAERLALLFARTEALRCLAHVQFKRGELSETVSLGKRIIEL